MHNLHLICAVIVVLLFQVTAAATAQESKHLALTLERGERSVAYRLLPPAQVVEGQRYPLVLFLHGAGERGGDNSAQLRHFPERMESAAYREEFPCFVLSPQCPAGGRWAGESAPLGQGGSFDAPITSTMEDAIATLRAVVREYPIDLDRIYLTGLSLGGAGAWDLAARHPGWFAAAAPICGGGDPAAAARLAGLPISVWHGGADTAVDPALSSTMVEALKEVGSDVQYHELEGVGHGVWARAYDPDGVLPWLFEQRRSGERELAAAAELFAKVARPDLKVAFLGDSITQAGNGDGGYVDLLRKTLLAMHPEAEVIPAGISGHKVPDLLARYETDVIAKGANLVFVYIGINDVWHSQSGRGTPKAEFAEGLRKIVRRLRETGAEVVLATPSVIGEKPQGQNTLDEMLTEYAAVSRLVAIEEGVTLCDLRQAFLDHLGVFNPDDLPQGVLTRDGVHLNAAGNVFVATEAARALREALIKK